MPFIDRPKGAKKFDELQENELDIEIVRFAHGKESLFSHYGKNLHNISSWNPVAHSSVIIEVRIPLDFDIQGYNQFIAGNVNERLFGLTMSDEITTEVDREQKNEHIIKLVRTECGLKLVAYMRVDYNAASCQWLCFYPLCVEEYNILKWESPPIPRKVKDIPPPQWFMYDVRFHNCIHVSNHILKHLRSSNVEPPKALSCVIM